MSVENVKNLYVAMTNDEMLRNQFRDLEGGQPGMVLNEHDAKKFFENAIQPLAERLGYSFTFEDLAAFEQSIRQDQNTDPLSDSELAAICGGNSPGDGGAGGYAWCYLLGFGQSGNGTPTINFGGCFFFGLIGAARPL